MDISFENKTINGYREILHQTKRTQETAESVVPDTNDDIGKIASVQTAVLLKSKDVTGRGVLVTGELSAALIYITESEKSVSYVRLSTPFTMEYDLPNADADVLAQIALSIQNSEARVLNPRKVSVTFELMGEMSCYRREDMAVQTSLPASAPEGLHARVEKAELVAINAVMEKTFAVNEQFIFPAGKPKPSQLVTQSADFSLTEPQLIGTKVIVKGTVVLTVCYLSDEVNYPVKAEFSTPFSQIIDTGEEQQGYCTPIIELTSCYCSLADTINGEKSLDAELHAVLELVCCSQQCVEYVSDVYSNVCPAECSIQTRQFSAVSAVQQLKLAADERVSVAEDCTDVLSVFPSVSQTVLTPDKVGAAVTLDIVYRTPDGSVSAVRRLISLESQNGEAQARLICARIADVYLRPDGSYIDAHICVELCYQCAGTIELKRVESVALDEAAAFEPAMFPAVTVVRAENESVWELAKSYHSSVECIKAVNELEEDLNGRLIMIPKAI